GSEIRRALRKLPGLDALGAGWPALLRARGLPTLETADPRTRQGALLFGSPLATPPAVPTPAVGRVGRSPAPLLFSRAFIEAWIASLTAGEPARVEANWLSFFEAAGGSIAPPELSLERHDDLVAELRRLNPQVERGRGPLTVERLADLLRPDDGDDGDVVDVPHDIGLAGGRRARRVPCAVAENCDPPGLEPPRVGW